MTRTPLLAAALAGLLSAASRADTEPIPPPREVRPDGSRDPAPPPDPATETARAAGLGGSPAAPSANPAETVEKIIQNTKDITERLSKTDTGPETIKTQDETLALIDSLLNRQENPPPSGGSADKKDMSEQKDKDKQDQKDQKSDTSPMPEPKGGNQPRDDNRQANGRRPRMGDQDKDQQPKDGKDPMPTGAQEKKDSQPMAKSGQPKPKDPMPGSPGPMAGNPMGTVLVRPTVPLDEDVQKEVWGNLPDRLRQQVTTYYKEQFMPRYADLLKQYYSSLANQGPRPLPELKK